MVFNGLSILSGLWGLICVGVTTPALAGKRYWRVAGVCTLILVCHTALLHGLGEMSLVESFLRSVLVALINVLAAYLLVHFAHNKRSVRDLFRRARKP